MDVALEQGFKRLLQNIGSGGISWIQTPNRLGKQGHAAHAAFSKAIPQNLTPFGGAKQLRTSLKNKKGSFGSQYIVLDPKHLTRRARQVAWALRTNWDFRHKHNRAWLQLIAIYGMPTPAGAKQQFQSITLRHEPPEKRGNVHRFWHLQVSMQVGGPGQQGIQVPLAVAIPDFLQSYPAVPLRAGDPLQALLAVLLSVYGTTTEFWSRSLLQLRDYDPAFRHAIEFVRSCCPQLAEELNLQAPSTTK